VLACDLVADDVDGPRAEQFGYVNRVIADDQLDDEVAAIASRLRASITTRSRVRSPTSTR
jgi:enoyl-CoA hydratase/carnithine racemase